MALTNQAGRDVRAAAILESELSPLDKVRGLVSLGYEEEIADFMVAGAQSGRNQMLYYEKLPQADYAEDGT